jgi:DNA-binding IclR family transcriptional regulator
MTQTENDRENGSQTLSRGLRVLEIIGDSEKSLSVAELSQLLGIHRSMVYRIVKTLELHGFIERLGSGRLELGSRIATLSRSVARNLQSVVTPELHLLAEKLDMTAFLVINDGESAVTLLSAEPQGAETTVRKKPGSRHSIDKGAPGHVIRSQIFPEEFPPLRFEYSQDEVLAGLASIAVPLVIPGRKPAAIAVLFLPTQVDKELIAEVLAESAVRIVRQLA